MSDTNTDNHSGRPANPIREALVGFLEAARNGMREPALAGWVRKHLLARGYLRLLDPLSGKLTLLEPDAGRLVMETLPGPVEPDREVATAIAQRARQRAIEMIELLLLSPPDDRFLVASIQSGRVVRHRGAKDRVATWAPRFQEGDALSYMLVSLLAADALEHRDDYDRLLRVCRTCGSVGFDADAVTRFACPEHFAFSGPPRIAKEEGTPVKDSGSRRRYSASSDTEPAFEVPIPKARR